MEINTPEIVITGQVCFLYNLNCTFRELFLTLQQIMVSEDWLLIFRRYHDFFQHIQSFFDFTRNSNYTNS
jgi:hypothetical protein